MELKKKTILQAVVCVVLLCVIWGGYYVVVHYGIDRILEIKSNDFSWVYQVDSVKTEGKDLILQGFAFEIKKDSERGAFEIVLQDIESGEMYFPKMVYVERKDVNDYFLCEYDYLQSGFEATISLKKIKLEERNYEVLMRVDGERLTYQTGTYISKGRLMYANPCEFKSLNVVGTELEKIVENGVLRVYRPDCGIYVYQYEGELYWIAEPTYEFDETNNAYMQWHLTTTQIENLPTLRLENQWTFDNLGFWFCDGELLECNTGKYRVAKRKMPTEYSILLMSTGKNVEGWIWAHEFRPFYDLK